MTMSLVALQQLGRALGVALVVQDQARRRIGGQFAARAPQAGAENAGINPVRGQIGPQDLCFDRIGWVVNCLHPNDLRALLNVDSMPVRA